MLPKKLQPLVDRWHTPEFADHLVTVGRISIGEAPLQDNTLRTPEGRVDFRGFSFPSASLDPFGVFGNLLVEKRVNYLRWDDVILEHFDFTAASIPEWTLDNTQLDDCLFDHADCHNWTLWRSDVTQCSFTHANLSNSSLGGNLDGQPTVWNDVDLTRADLRGTWYSDSDFHHVTFDNAKLDRAQFEGVLLDHCTFAGRLKKVFFTGMSSTNPQHTYGMHHVDLARTTFDDAIMCNYHLDTVKLPDHVVAIPNAPANYPRAADWLREHQPDEPQAELTIRILESSVRRSGWTDGAEVFNPADYSEEVRARLLDAFTALGLLD